MSDNEQLHHITQLSVEFSHRMRQKYIAGAVEHGGNLWQVSPSALLDMAIDEAIDQVVYLLTLKQVMTMEAEAMTTSASSTSWITKLLGLFFTPDSNGNTLVGNTINQVEQIHGDLKDGTAKTTIVKQTLVDAATDANIIAPNDSNMIDAASAIAETVIGAFQAAPVASNIGVTTASAPAATTNVPATSKAVTTTNYRINPAKAEVGEEETLQLALYPQPPAGEKVVYAIKGASASGGNCTANGLYTSGNKTGTDEVTASVNGAVVATATFAVDVDTD